MADAASMMSRARFVHGFQRSWETADQRQIVVYLYKFNYDAGATGYAQQLAASARTNRQFPVTAAAISGIPGTVGLSRSTAVGTTATALFTKGQYLVRLLVSRSTTGDSTVARLLAHVQYALL